MIQQELCECIPGTTPVHFIRVQAPVSNLRLATFLERLLQDFFLPFPDMANRCTRKFKMQNAYE